MVTVMGSRGKETSEGVIRPLIVLQMAPVQDPEGATVCRKNNEVIWLIWEKLKRSETVSKTLIWASVQSAIYSCNTAYVEKE